MAKSSLISAANPQQLEAITTTEGPLLIIAGPGSGKTFTLVERVVFLLTEKNITPERIMVVTFTEKAAQELTTRISNRLDHIGVRFNLNEMYLGTFHSICLRWLQDHREYTRLKHNFTIFDEFDQHYFVYQHFSAFEALEGITHLAGKPDTTSTWERSEELLKWINTVSEESLNVETLLAAPDEAIRALGRCAHLYYTQLAENNALDFSTIQSEALQLLRHYPSVRDALHAQIAYVMVDEYQDTNTIQEQILLELVGTDSPNLCVVGDDDQGIYRFRGATIRNILQFGSTFTGTRKQVALETNYRSHEAIIEFCACWMTGQEWTHQGQNFRYHKQIVPRPAVFPTMPTVVRVSAKSDVAWQEEVLNFLQTLRTEGHLTDWNQAAFLFRWVKIPKFGRWPPTEDMAFLILRVPTSSLIAQGSASDNRCARSSSSPSLLRCGSGERMLISLSGITTIQSALPPLPRPFVSPRMPTCGTGPGRRRSSIAPLSKMPTTPSPVCSLSFCTFLSLVAIWRRIYSKKAWNEPGDA